MICSGCNVEYHILVASVNEAGKSTNRAQVRVEVVAEVGDGFH